MEIPPITNQQPMPLYRRLLGDGFEELHPLLRQFHSSTSSARAAGPFRVTRPGGFLVNALASLAGIPPAGEHVMVHLEVSVEGDAERWVRMFNRAPLVTRQTVRNGMLLEQAGLLRLGFEPVIDGQGFNLFSRRCWLLGIPLPRCCSPAVEAHVLPDDAGWAVRVSLRAPLLGQLFHYEGHVAPL